MKNKQFKGFTLIELIIVMAVMSILMVGIMQMVKPIRNTYVDATYYESQRNTQNGIATYIGESLRYATNMGIYTEGVTGGVSSLSDALTKFETTSEITDRSKYNILIIDNNAAYKFNNADCYGRVLRSKTVSTSSCTTRLALGEAYYGKYTYSINLDPVTTDNTTLQGLKITVSSLLPSSLNKANANGLNSTDLISNTDYKFVSTDFEVPFRNLELTTTGIGKSDITYAKSTTASGAKTYIIFTLPET